MFDPGWPSNQVSGCTSGLVVQQLVFLPLKRENAGLLKLHFCKDFGAKLLVDRLLPSSASEAYHMNRFQMIEVRDLHFKAKTLLLAANKKCVGLFEGHSLDRERLVNLLHDLPRSFGRGAGNIERPSTRAHRFVSILGAASAFTVKCIRRGCCGRRHGGPSLAAEEVRRHRRGGGGRALGGSGEATPAAAVGPPRAHWS